MMSVCLPAFLLCFCVLCFSAFSVTSDLLEVDQMTLSVFSDSACTQPFQSSSLDLVEAPLGDCDSDSSQTFNSTLPFCSQWTDYPVLGTNFSIVSVDYLNTSGPAITNSSSDDNCPFSYWTYGLTVNGYNHSMGGCVPAELIQRIGNGSPNPLIVRSSVFVTFFCWEVLPSDNCPPTTSTASATNYKAQFVVALSVCLTVIVLLLLVVICLSWRLLGGDKSGQWTTRQQWTFGRKTTNQSLQLGQNDHHEEL